MLLVQAVLDVNPAIARSGGGGSAGNPRAAAEGPGSDTRNALDYDGLDSDQ